MARKVGYEDQTRIHDISTLRANLANALPPRTAMLIKHTGLPPMTMAEPQTSLFRHL